MLQDLRATVGGERAEPVQPVRLAGLGTATASHRVSSRVLAEVLASLWPQLRGRAERLLEDAGSEGRYLSRPVAELRQGLSLSRQRTLYPELACALAARAARAALAEAGRDPRSVGALIVVSCTGFVLPGLDARLVFELGLRPEVVRMPFTQLGCAGGAAGLARGAEWVRGGSERRALVVAVELPSLTFRPADRSSDNLLSALVFGDGAGAALLEAGGGGGSLELGRTRGVLVEDSVVDLGYELVDDGFRVILSRRLPRLIEGRLAPIVADFLDGVAVDSLEVLAVHPGGGAVLEAVRRGLGAVPGQLDASWAAFRSVGNTSSAALFFVLAEVAGRRPARGSRGLALAFGPGLAIELLELAWPT